MALLRLAVALGIAGAVPACYSPDLRDCVVACTAASDCATGQVCGADRFCAAPSVAGQCDQLAPPVDAGADASRPPVDAPRDAAVPPIDAAPPPDAPPQLVLLRVKVNGRGRVAVAGVGTCATPAAAGNVECQYAVPIGNVQLDATASPGWYFDKWTEGCQGQGPSCTTAVLAPTTVQAKFRQGDDDDDD